MDSDSTQSGTHCAFIRVILTENLKETVFFESMKYWTIYLKLCTTQINANGSNTFHKIVQSATIPVTLMHAVSENTTEQQQYQIDLPLYLTSAMISVRCAH